MTSAESPPPSRDFGRKGRLPPRTQRGGRDFKETDAYAEVIADYATLFIDEVPEKLVAGVLRDIIGAFGVPDSPLNRKLTDAFSKAILRDLKEKLGDKLGTIIRDRGPIITRLSEQLCRLLPGCNSDTVSAEVAKRKGTTIQGAHAWMVRPLLFIRGGPATFALEVLRVEARFSCIQHGDANEMRRFFQTEALLTGAPSFGDALRAIDRGCPR